MTRQVLIAGVVLGLTAAAIVWFLESFERQRLRDDWHSFIDEWEAKAHGGSTATDA